jgi:hypothetical protein
MMMAGRMAARDRVALEDTRIRPGRGARRAVSIWQLLVWAFQSEKASLDFDELASVSGVRPGIGTEWLLMQRKDGLGGDWGFWCPVHFHGDARSTAALRRAWFDWWGALLELQTTFRIGDDLGGFTVTDEMPPLEPWKEGA